MDLHNHLTAILERTVAVLVQVTEAAVAATTVAMEVITAAFTRADLTGVILLWMLNGTNA